MATRKGYAKDLQKAAKTQLRRELLEKRARCIAIGDAEAMKAVKVIDNELARRK